MSSIGIEFLKEQERVRELLTEYEAIGSTGVFGATMIKESLCKAEQASISGDVIKILQAYEDLKNIK